MSERQVSRTVVVHASPQQIFALLADPREHPGLDGSGTVKGATTGPDTLSLGAKFGMRMKQFGLPYPIKNEVVEFEQDRLIAWRHPGKHVWRWELEPVDGGTQVTETFDYAPSPAARGLELVKFPARNAAGIEATLRGLQERFA
jgi:uncharacterized protein YndB with AHSA1/START domain